MKHRVNNASNRARMGKGLIAMTALLACQGLWAQVPDDGYELSYVANAAHGDLIADGRYRLAIHLLSGGGHDPLARMTNLCVARTMLGEFSKARRDCNRAVQLSEEAALAAAEDERQNSYGNWATALSNRGVMRAIRELDGAEEDFLQAIELQAFPDTATRNLARFNRAEHPELAAK